MVNQFVILNISGDRASQSALSKTLRLDGRFVVVEVADLASAHLRFDIGDPQFDAVIINVGDRAGDGFQVCRSLRDAGLRLPIVILASSSDETDVVRGLNAGANDYIVQPCQPRELAARLNAHIRSFALTEDAVIKIGPFIFWPSKQELRHSQTKRKIRLTTKEAKLLRILYEAGGAPVRREDLLREVFGYGRAVFTHTLETHIYRLRKRIEAESDDLKIILSGHSCYWLDITPGAAG